MKILKMLWCKLRGKHHCFNVDVNIETNSKIAFFNYHCKNCSYSWESTQQLDEQLIESIKHGNNPELVDLIANNNFYNIMNMTKH